MKISFSRRHNYDFQPLWTDAHPSLLIVFRSQVEEQVEYPVSRLVFNTASLDEELSLAEAGLETESSIDALVALDGGKRKRKKKVYTKPKKIAHKHKKRSQALLDYYNVEASGKIKKLKNECNKCEVATYMADHPDRFTCGKCGHMLYRLTAKGERLPIPKQNKPQAAATVVVAKKDTKKKKK